MKYKLGDLVQAQFDVPDLITKGKIYKIIKIDENGLWIYDDRGIRGWENFDSPLFDYPEDYILKEIWKE